MNSSLNIVELIESNPITKLSSTYNGKLLTKIQEKFNGFEQQLFVSSFYCYLNCDPKNDFIIDLDNVWKWLGFKQKVNAKVLLEKVFMIEKDYIILIRPSAEQKCHDHTDESTNNNLHNQSSVLLLLQQKQSTNTRGGHNKEIIMLTVKTFKAFCMKAGTKKADEIHEYYLKMEETLHDVIKEESDELKIQLDHAKKMIETAAVQNEKKNEQLVEETLLLQFPINTQCIYYGRIDNRSLGQAPRLHNEQLIKFGQSNNLSDRVAVHRKTFDNFRLVAAFKVKNKIEIENCMKKHPVLQKRIRSLTINDLNYRELLAIDSDKFTIERIDDYIKEIIKDNEYNIENYKQLLEKNCKLDDEICRLEKELKEKDEHIGKINKELTAYKSDISTDVKNKISSNYAICKYGYFLYAFECQPMRFKCSIVRQKDYDALLNNLIQLDPTGEMKHSQKVSYPLTEKIMVFLLKQSLTSIGNNTYEGSIIDIKKILNVVTQFELLLIEKGKDLDDIILILKNQASNSVVANLDPETPVVRKAKRSIDKINIETGEIMATYESIEAAGRSTGLTTGAAIGMALREKRQCKGFLWRYSGISKEDQFSEQPVIKINCKNGIMTSFKTITDAARDSNVSAPAMRQRILTNVHTNDHHWVFDKHSSHYN